MQKIYNFRNRKIIMILFLIFSEYIQAINTDEMINSSWTGSLMFNNKQFEELNNAIEFHQKEFFSQKEKFSHIDENAQVNPNMHDQDHHKLSENIFLASVIYNSKNDWTIWLNDKKITSDQKKKIFVNESMEINVIEVSGSMIIAELSVENIDILSPNWDKEFLNSGKSIFKSKKYDITYDKNENKIQFSLKPNQSLIIHDLKIIEGERAAVISAE